MHAFTNLAPRQSEPLVSVANGIGEGGDFIPLRNRRAAASGMIGVWTGLLKALHDSRSRLAVRVDRSASALLWGLQPMSATSYAHAGEPVCGQPKAGSNDIMSWRVSFL